MTIDASVMRPSYQAYYKMRYEEERAYNREHRVFQETAIDNYLEKNPDLTRAEVETEIARRDSYLARDFIKDPVTQNCSERYCLEYLDLYAPGKCEKLPSSSRKNSLYLYCGKVYSYYELPDKARGRVKSIDFKLLYKDYIIFISSKYTRKEGGAQNNQWHDLDTFGEHAGMCTEDKVIFIALADGEYYSVVRNGRTRLAMLNDRANEHFRAMTTTEFCDWLHTLS